jgi:Flp pilus assembly protein TadG
MFVPLLVLLIAMCGMALDTGAMYNRKVELSGLAKAAALAAAQELNGTSAGVASAQLKAKEAAERFKYQYGLSVTWKDTAITFSTTPARSGEWVLGPEVSNASAYFFAKVDTSALESVGTVRPLFMPIISSSLSTVLVSDIAVAGRATINVAPIAICAMSEDAATERTNTGLTDNELVEYGFRRGVNYDLMQLNPKATTPARYLVNPVSAPGTSSSSFNTSIIGPFACTGTMWIPRVKGGFIHVTSLDATSPLLPVYRQLNSRLDDYTGGLCSPTSAPPDSNVKPYFYDTTGGAPWMSPATGTRAATSTTERGKLETVADIPPPGSTLPGLTAGSYGPVWSFAKAVKFSSYAAGVPEPSAGYATFSTGDWAKLYKTGMSSSGYPTAAQSTPYNPVGSTNPNTIAAPLATRKDFITPLRRVLNIPLLSCATVPTGSNVEATVKGISKFFMTIPATQDKLIAEFAGMTSEDALIGPVELFP